MDSAALNLLRTGTYKLHSPLIVILGVSVVTCMCLLHGWVSTLLLINLAKEGVGREGRIEGEKDFPPRPVLM